MPKSRSLYSYKPIAKVTFSYIINNPNAKVTYSHTLTIQMPKLRILIFLQSECQPLLRSPPSYSFFSSIFSSSSSVYFCCWLAGVECLPSRMRFGRCGPSCSRLYFWPLALAFDRFDGFRLSVTFCYFLFLCVTVTVTFCYFLLY